MKITQVVSPEKAQSLLITIDEMQYGIIYRNAFVAGKYCILPRNMPRTGPNREILSISIRENSIAVLPVATWKDWSTPFLEPLPAGTKLELSND